MLCANLNDWGPLRFQYMVQDVGGIYGSARGMREACSRRDIRRPWYVYNVALWTCKWLNSNPSHR